MLKAPYNLRNSSTNNQHSLSKISSLLQNLDAELRELCHKCKVPKLKSLGRFSSGSNTNNNKKTKTYSAQSNQNINSRNNKLGVGQKHFVNMLAINKEDGNNPTGSQLRNLANIYRSRVIEAYRNRRIFTVYGHYHTIRRALLRRGWVEKLPAGRFPKLQNLPEDVLLQHAKRGNEFEAVLLSRILQNLPAFFIWQPRNQRDLFADVLPLRNRVRRGRNLDFATKVGLIGCAEQEQWFTEEGLCGMKYPRFYRLGGGYEERMAFIEDFRQTQCWCLLRYITQNINEPDELIDKERGTVLLSTVNFALAHVIKHLAELENTTVDEDIVTNIDNEIVEWQNFMINSNLILRNKTKFKVNYNELSEVSDIARDKLAKLQQLRPEYKWDGCRNLWILKPGYQCRGIGIIIRSSLDDILSWTSNNITRRYIAQKYIERPLLIYKTKFDIRQYMLLTIGEALVTIWLYRDCYLRFSSQEFSIENLTDAIHLTNNSVQKKCRNQHDRDSRLPKSNMWSLEQFKVYLKVHNSIHTDDIWERIFSGFRENLISVVLASLEETEFIQNSFELYGCDFMLDEDYNPILIEINSTPDLTPSTEVTARICPMALKDLVKVVVDLPRNPRAATGLFKKVFEVNYKIRKDNEQEKSLDVNGTAMTLYTTMRQTQRQKLLKKPLKLLKKAESSIKKLRIKKMHADQHPLPPKGVSPFTADAGGGPSLGSSTKEALALRYTTPK